MSGAQPAGSPASGNPDALLSRELGVRSFAANIFNYTVGSGIFSLPAFAVIGLGSAAPLAYVACAIVIGLVVLCFAESGSRVSSTGGAYAYVETALGPMIGFVAGCLVFTTGWFAAAAVITAVVRSLLALTSGTPAWLTQVLMVVVVTILVTLNMRGVRTGARLLETITVVKLVPLLVFVGIGVFFIDTSHLAWTTVPAASTVLSTAGIIIFAFSGIEGATVPSGEVKNPARTVPRAILLALGASTVLYLAIQFVALGIMGPALANTGNTPLAEAAGMALGPVARTIMILAAVVSMFGYLSANVLSEPRGLFAMSRDGFLPRQLTAVHPTFRTPNFAIGIYGVLVAVVALGSATFRVADGLCEPRGAGAVFPVRDRDAGAAQARRAHGRPAVRDPGRSAGADCRVRGDRLAVLRNRPRRRAVQGIDRRPGGHLRPVRPAGAASQASGCAGTREIACCGGIRCCSPSGSRFAICCDERRHTPQLS